MSKIRKRKGLLNNEQRRHLKDILHLVATGQFGLFGYAQLTSTSPDAVMLVLSFVLFLALELAAFVTLDDVE